MIKARAEPARKTRLASQVSQDQQRVKPHGDVDQVTRAAALAGPNEQSR